MIVEQTETLEELNEWKAVLEGALAQAPSANQVMGPSGIFLNEVADSIEASVDLCNSLREQDYYSAAMHS